ncbi:YraN family protein [Parvibium lacunae]|uniref:UPF0102 protein DU000_09750 n=2 Tax=Parvibium lacunae TaxID=1888893 RepID=A0A368L0T0_9BURK|nr:YraN family protein [Parvibium lacunae]RCS57171.1 YraN family protein [Parvibium lacunae]
MPAEHLTRGAAAEAAARAHLETHGLRWVASNVRYRHGELDLIMQQHDTLVFVEVRYRQSARYGGAIASVTPAKQARVRAAAAAYLQAQSAYQSMPCRFDVVAITGNDIEWLTGAF